MSFAAPSSAIPRIGSNASSQRSGTKLLDDVRDRTSSNAKFKFDEECEAGWDWAAPGLFNCDVQYRGVIITPVKFPKEGSMTPSEFGVLAEAVSSHVRLVYEGVAMHKKGTPSRLSISQKGMRMSSKKSGDVLMSLPISRVLTYKRDKDSKSAQKNKCLSAIILAEHPDPAIDTIVCHRIEFKQAAHLSAMFGAFRQAFANFVAEPQPTPTPAAPAATPAPSKPAAEGQAPSAPAPELDLEELEELDEGLAMNRRMLVDAEVLECYSTC